MTLTEKEKAEKWDKYSQQFETALRLYTDCKTMEEFFIKNELPKFLVTITEDGKTKMEKIDSVKKLEVENKQLKGNFMFANKWASEQTQTINNLNQKLDEIELLTKGLPEISIQQIKEIFHTIHSMEKIKNEI